MSLHSVEGPTRRWLLAREVAVAIELIPFDHMSAQVRPTMRIDFAAQLHGTDVVH